MSTQKTWIKEIEKNLLGKTITGIRYMSAAEVEHFGWYDKAVIIQLNDGGELMASADDEGNNAGAIFTTYEGLEVIPVMGA